MIPLPPSAFGTAIRMVPVVLIVILMFPAWLTWPFLSEKRRQSVLQMVHVLARWAAGDSLDSVDPSSDGSTLNSDSCDTAIEGGDELG
jgi:hypothetical protein